MGARSVTEEQLAELKAAREAADARYNQALTELDAALRPLPAEFPHPPPEPDEQQITPLNRRWEILETTPPLPTGWRGRLAGFVWGLVEPPLARQQAFNAALVEHVNRNVERQRELPKAVASTLSVLREQLEHVLTFHSKLLLYLQQVTPYVDSKDYEFAGLGRRVDEDTQEQIARTDLIARGLAGGLSGLSDELLRRFESLVARDRRYEGAITELKATVGSLQQLTQTLRRELERRVADTGDRGQDRQPARGNRQPEGTPHSPAFDQLASDPLQSHHYVGFEDLYRGSEIDVAGRMGGYVDLFRGGSDVLDIGCGRGELLLLLREAGASARGIDLNSEMVERCRARGLDVTQSDALGYLLSLPDESLGGVIATQVVEHLPPDYLLRLLSATFDKLRPGSTLVLETINAASWAAFFDSYIRDLTHVRPVHPDTLRYLVTASGFADARIAWQSPYPGESKLQRLSTTLDESTVDRDLAGLAATFNANVDRLNGLLFTYMDYAVIAQRR